MNKLTSFASTVFIATLAFAPAVMAAGYGEEGEKSRSGAQVQSEEQQQVGQQSGQAEQLSESQVRQIQQQLQAQGVDPGPIDGIWGPQTSQALEQFQQQEGIAASGQPDQETLQSLGVETDQEFMGVSPGFGEEQQRERGVEDPMRGEGLEQDRERSLERDQMEREDSMQPTTPGQGIR
ncbi:MAG: peptidoglycan-binding protein [Desulfuromonadales bacterium]|nr:peptidoglycan-binding protein [Desulfuromonadales bacterium]